MVNVAVLVSGGGTNLQAIIDAKAAGRIPDAELALVIASRADAYALTRAANAGIPSGVCHKEKGQSIESYGEQLLDVLKRYRAERIPLDGIILDWRYWGEDNARWNAMDFDPSIFPDPKGMFAKIRSHGWRAMI